MLTDLQIKNFAIIDDLHISFSPEFTILSGETGAGKSIIIGALNLILGGRATGDLIRTGENEAVVEALFDIASDEPLRNGLAEKGLSSVDNHAFLVKRTISREGKNKIIINGNLATLTILTEITESLLTISGQHEHQELLRPQSHIDILDNYGGLLPFRTQYQQTFQKMRNLKEELEKVKAKKDEEEKEQELLNFQWQEIEDARLVPGEEEELKKEKKIVQNSGELIKTTRQIYENIYGGENAIIPQLTKNVRDLKELTVIDSRMDSYVETLESVLIQLEDISISLRNYSQKIHFDPQGIEEIEGRLDTLHRLKRKYGKNIEEVLELQKKIALKIKHLSQQKDYLSDLEQKYKAASKEAALQAENLSVKREKIASHLRTKIEKELESLDMQGIKFCADITQSKTGDLHEKGRDRVEFLISPNIGEKLRPLARIASGGELSRVMLAFKNIFAQQKEVSTLIFDEVDSGIGGATAEVVGQKLDEISRYYQTICITHLPQIACYGDSHYLISKKIENGRTKTMVTLLNSEKRMDEIARMLGGTEITTKTRTLAQEMLGGLKKGKGKK
ncbi:MAG: DNA repair protein RecN [Deltaproteobacteria bacterium]|nr:DNA repair protein RecN [Deltaproteobacteria bacterium]